MIHNKPNNSHSIFLFLLTFIFISSALCEQKLQKLNNEIQKLFTDDLLSTNPACKAELEKICVKDVLENNLDTLRCVDEKVQESLIQISDACQNEIWHLKNRITKKDYFSEITRMLCKDLVVNSPECSNIEDDTLSPGTAMLSCLLEHLQPDTSRTCKTYLREMELISFSDYRLIHKFTSVCEQHVRQYSCGRIDAKDGQLHSQANTVDCLQQHVSNLSNDCQHEILRISELQGDDFHLDKPLFFACRSDRERFCADVRSGDGKVYQCLMRHRKSDQMSESCHDKLNQREALIAQDYKVSKSLVQACKRDIRTYHCRTETSQRREIRLAQILLCLEDAQKKDLPISPPCSAEMIVHRQSLFENYKLSPALVQDCKEDIHQFCGDLEHSDKIIHCLMKNAKSKRHRGDAHEREKISAKCQRQVEALLKETDATSDWRVDPVLKEACQSTVNSLCAEVKAGDGKVLECLADHISSPDMKPECQQALHQMQYFVSRDFDLDSQLYHSCHDDAVRHCHARKNWNKQDDDGDMDPERGPTVLSCLYRYVYHPDPNVRLTKDCSKQIRRVMQQRASSIDLMPVLEEPCLEDLGRFCSDDHVIEEKNGEMGCLQENWDSLSPRCRLAVGNFTQEQSGHFELNVPLFMHCAVVAKELCRDEFEAYLEDDQGDVVDCLIKHKNSHKLKQNRKCRVAIEHYQLLNMKDFHFDQKFSDACSVSINQFCGKLTFKYDVINCLSTMIYNDTISEAKRKRVPAPCRQMLKQQILSEDEDIELDQSLAAACKFDRQQFCSKLEHGEAQVLDCLKQNLVRLKKSCQRQLYHRQYISMVDNSVDYSLLHRCKLAIDSFCHSSDIKDVLYCLRDHRNQISGSCLELLDHRLGTQNLDYRLNPRLKKACKPEIKTFCSVILKSHHRDDLLEGKVIGCLKEHYLRKELSSGCENEVVNIIREVSQNIQLDPVLYHICQTEIQKNCAQQIDIHECLKTRFMATKIEDVHCKREVARVIRESSADIESDPHLYSVCTQDLKTHCSDVTSGAGNRLNCLATIHRNSPKKLTQECGTLLQKRLQLFEYASQVYPLASVAKLVEMVQTSPVHNTIYGVVFAIVVFIFVIGLYTGRNSQKRLLSEKAK